MVSHTTSPPLTTLAAETPRYHEKTKKLEMDHDRDGVISLMQDNTSILPP